MYVLYSQAQDRDVRAIQSGARSWCMCYTVRRKIIMYVLCSQAQDHDVRAMQSGARSWCTCYADRRKIMMHVLCSQAQDHDARAMQSGARSWCTGYAVRRKIMMHVLCSQAQDHDTRAMQSGARSWLHHRLLLAVFTQCTAIIITNLSLSRLRLFSPTGPESSANSTIKHVHLLYLIPIVVIYHAGFRPALFSLSEVGQCLVQGVIAALVTGYYYYY